MLIRNIAGNDTNEIIALWKKVLPYLVIDRKLFMQKVYLEANFKKEGFFVAEKDGKIVGFTQAIFRNVPICADAETEKDIGWINGFIVDKDHIDVADSLLEASENYLRAKGKTTISTGYYPTYFTQGLDEQFMPECINVFEKHGYSSTRSISMSVNLDKYTPPSNLEEKRQTLINKGIQFGPMTDEHIISLFTLENEFMTPSWMFEYKSRIADMDFERFRIATADDKVIGVCAFSDPGSVAERFGPFGVSKSYQGCGIGNVLLADTLTEMKKRGLHEAWMQWASDDIGANILYNRAGFKEIRSYREFKKDL